MVSCWIPRVRAGEHRMTTLSSDVDRNGGPWLAATSQSVCLGSCVDDYESETRLWSKMHISKDSSLHFDSFKKLEPTPRQHQHFPCCQTGK